MTGSEALFVTPGDGTHRTLALRESVGRSPDVALTYLSRLPKARFIEAVREGKGKGAAQLIDHLKEGDMAVEAERLLKGSGWLPDLLCRADLVALQGETSEGQGDDAGIAPRVEDMSSDMVDLPAFLVVGLPADPAQMIAAE